MKPRRFKLKQSAILAASIQLALSAPLVWGNPTGPQVVNGSATFQNQGAGTLNVTNSPGAIINWQGFSIGASEVTRFIQNSASSVVLNRVVGPDISSIQGQLLSNGRVFLINPAGIVIGPGAMIDTAGFVGSTLNMLDADFLAGKLKFQGDASSGSVINQGWIRTSSGGQVILVAPNIENSGLIQTPGGELILAAGKSMTIGSLQHEGVQFEIQAPADSVLNVGKLLADGGAVGVFAGTLRHSGEIRANALVRDEGGKIVLKAASDIQVAAGSITSANGKSGGTITIESTAGHSRIAGQVTATGSDGKGGNISLLGSRVTATDGALVDASGSAGGGQILLGGDYQGNNPAVRNSTNTFVGATATLRADATQAGDGGRIIVWSDDKAQFYGNLSARGGPAGGNGGFAEVSGKQSLIFAGGADLSAPLGTSGTLLLDPLDLYVFAGGGVVPSIIDEGTDFPSNAATVSPATLAAIAGNVTLFASRYMRISDPIVLNPGQSLTATVGAWTTPALPDPIALDAVTPNRLDIAANITTAGGGVTLTAPSIQAVSTSAIATAGGAINLSTTGTGAIQASLLSLNAGAGAVTVLPGGFLQLGAVTGGSFTATSPSFISIGGLITTSGGAVSLTSTGSSVTTSAGATTGGGAVTLAGTSSVNNFGTVSAGGGAVSMSGSSVSGGTIDTAGAVTLTGTSSSVSATVNNASSLTASGAFSVSINSSTDLNVATVTATNNGSASLVTSNGTIRATSDASKITGLDVTLQTGQLTGGGVVGATLPLNVDVQRTFTFRPNGTFDVALSGTGPNRLNVEVGVAPATQSYSGTLTGPGLVFNASANDNTVTFNNLAITSGFDQRVAFTDPSITFRVPNGALVANSVTVPTGDPVPTIGFPNGFPLPVSLSSFGNLTLSSYTRAGGGLTKSTSILSNTGNVTLGSFDASKDNVSINNPLITTISSLITAGNVTISSGGTKAQSDSAVLEINAGGTISISSSGSIGTAGFANPLDLTAASVSLSTINSGSMIGDVTGPVVANTENLTISAPLGQFNVSTGVTALKNLTVTADPSWVGNGGLAQVRTEAGGANDKTYTFASDGTDFTLAIGTVPVTQFVNGNFNFTSQSGSINLTGNTVFGTGNLNLTTNGNGIFGSDISAANVTLTANSTIDTDTGAITATGAGGNITLRADSSIVAGDLNAPGTIDISNRFCCADASVSVGAIGNVTAPQSISIRGSGVDVGAVTGAGDITLNANNGLLSLGGAVTTADGNTVTLRSTDNVNSLSFSKIDAGLTGTVSITSSSNIIQTSADAAGNGITAENVTLTATGTGAIGRIEQTGGGSDGHVDLFGVKNLTFSTGELVQLNIQGSTLTDLTISRNQIPDNSTISLINLGGGQTVDLSGGSSDQPLTVSSPTPLNFSLDYFTGGDITLAGSGITTSGGSVSLRSSGGIDATTGGITTAGGNVYLEASGGLIDTGTINASGGAGTGRVEMWNFAGIGTAIDVSGNVTAGSTGSVFMAATGGSIVRTGGSVITGGTSATLSSNFGNLGAAGTPLLITAPTVTLSATGNPTSLCTSSGCAFATLTGTSNLTLTAYDGFNVSSDTALSTLSLTTRGFGYGTPGNSTLNLSAPGQTYLFDRPATDLFSNPITNTFRVVSVAGPTTATFATNTGDLLVAGGAGTFNIPNLSFFTSGLGDLKFQGTSGSSLSLNNATQSFSAGRDLLISGTVNLVSSGNQSFSSGRDLLVTGDMDLIASGNQTFQATRHITVTASGGSIVISAPNQTFTTSSGASKMEFFGGSGAGEKVTVTSTNNQTVNSTSSSVDAFKLLGGSGADASVTFTHSGAGVQEFQVSNGTVTVAGGSGTNASAKIEETGSNAQQLCRDSFFSVCASGINTLNILGGSGDGAFAQITAAGSQLARIFGTTNVKAGTGSGAYALMQAGTTQTFFQTGNLTVEGGTNAATTAKAEILAGSTQSISGAGAILVKAGAGADSLARIATTGSQSISGSSLTLTAGGTEISPIAGASAIVEGGSQSISVSSLILNGGSGTGAGTTSDALLRTLTGSQSVNATTIALNGGHQFSTAGILNQGTGTQSVTGNSGITLTSDLNSHSDSFVLIQNTPSTQQTISASNGSLRLNNRGGGTVSITSAGNQTVTAGAIEVLTNSTTEPGPGVATISATGNQWIRTLNGTLSGFGSMRVAALGAGKASIESGASQLIQLDYPEQMQFTRDGSLTVGDINAAGTSRIKAVDQTIFAKSIVVQSGLTNSLSEIKASNNQVITTLNGNIQVLGGSGANTLAQIDPVMQTILVNGGIDVTGGSGVNSIAQIVASTGTTLNGQTIYATNGDITLTGGTAAGAAALITNLGSSSFVGASGDIVLTAGTQPGADAIIGVGGGPGVLTLLCGGSCILPPVGATPTAGILANQSPSTPSTPFDTTSTLIALQQDQDEARFDAAPDETAEESADVQRPPICQ